MRATLSALFPCFSLTHPTLSYCSKGYQQEVRFVATHSGRFDSMAAPSLGGQKKFFHRGPNSLLAALYFIYCLHSLVFVCGSRVCQRLEVFAPSAIRTAHTFHYCSVTEACAHGVPATLSTKETRPEKGALLTNIVPSRISHFGFPATR